MNDITMNVSYKSVRIILDRSFKIYIMMYRKRRGRNNINNMRD